MKIQGFLSFMGMTALSGAVMCAEASDPPIVATKIPLSGVAGGAGSYAPVFSADGRFLVFTSRANNLVTNDSNEIWSDVFVRDLVNNTTTLVSRSTNSFGGGNGNSINPVISSNGQFIAFESPANNLVPDDTNGLYDVFVRDLVAGTTVLVSVSTNAGVGDGPSRFPVMTPDGRWVAFESTATNLAAGDVNGIKDVFLRDLQTGTTLRVSDGSVSPGVGSESPTLSADGRWVAFFSDAIFGSAKTKSKGEVYVRDVAGGTTTWASTNVYVLATNANTRLWSYNPAVSADGRFVAFKSAFTPNATQPTVTNLYVHDLLSQTTTFVSSNVWEDGFPEMTPDGRFVAYESRTNVFLWDSQTGSNLLVSVDLAGTNAASGTSYRPALTPDGTKVAFLSDASNLTTNGGNGQPQIFVRDLVTGITRLVTVNLAGQPGASMSGTIPALSPDGNKVGFWSTDGQVVAEDNNEDADVFLRDLAAETTSLVSAGRSELPSQTGGGVVKLAEDSVSADGRYVLLGVYGSRLVAGDTTAQPHLVLADLATKTHIAVDALDNPNALPVAVTNLPFPTNFAADSAVLSAHGRYVAYVGRPTTGSSVDQVYVRDTHSATNWLASRAWNSSVAGSAKSAAPSLSGDGRWVAFHSDAANLVPVDANGATDVFVRDLFMGLNFMVSTNRFGTGGGNGSSTNPVISRDGRWVVFQSRASNLVTNSGTGTAAQLFVRDRQLNATALISKATNGTALAGNSGSPWISPGNRWVLYTNQNKLAFLYDLQNGTNTMICTNCYAPAMSAEGRWVAYEVVGTNQIRDIVLLDRQTGETNLMSINRTATGGGNGSSFKPVVSYDGRYVVFASRASDLAEGDANGLTDIFVRDRVLNTTVLASLNRQGTASGNSSSSRPILGADGRSVAFFSFADDLVAGDFNGNRDVFLLRLEADDSDGDGLPDDWELAYFGELGRDGAGDYDGDGHTDFQEYLTGTDPTNTGDILRVMTIASLGGDTTVLWNATPGKSYRVQVKTNLTDPGWADLPGMVTATNSSAFLVDDAAGTETQRFYRVRLSP